MLFSFSSRNLWVKYKKKVFDKSDLDNLNNFEVKKSCLDNGKLHE